MAEAFSGAAVLFARMKAMRRPSGDQVGEWSSVPEFGWSWVSWRTFEPFASMTKIPTTAGGPSEGSGPIAPITAIRRPFGDQAGCAYPRQSPVQAVRVRSRSPEPSRFTTITASGAPLWKTRPKAIRRPSGEKSASESLSAFGPGRVSGRSPEPSGLIVYRRTFAILGSKRLKTISPCPGWPAAAGAPAAGSSPPPAHPEERTTTPTSASITVERRMAEPLRADLAGMSQHVAGRVAAAHGAWEA